ncbi:hypothetical protein [Cryobacterium soli]|uniref:hypothetical protein n=1 Tax=Cryobacterium soli TaxID=2220095 RepID=UPI000E70FAD5|nr:hypothetical protein [Cryobacterium soli]
MTTDRRTALRRRYLNLGLGELAACLVFTVVAGAMVVPRLESAGDTAAVWSALLPLLVVLAQAGAYWLLAFSWVERAAMPASLAAVNRAFRMLDVLLLAVGLVGVVIWWPENIAVAVLIVAVWAFGAVEYLNYFVVRLAYPATRWLTSVRRAQTPRLVLDLRDSA